MSRLQQLFIAITFLGPIALWLLSRRVRSPRLARGISTTIAALLIAAYGTALVLKWRGDGLDIDGTLPMQLCDWAAGATILALAWRHQTAFELAYFWGLAGTSQALFTPAVDLTADLPSVPGGGRLTLRAVAVRFCWLKNRNEPEVTHRSRLAATAIQPSQL